MTTTSLSVAQPDWILPEENKTRHPFAHPHSSNMEFTPIFIENLKKNLCFSVSLDHTILLIMGRLSVSRELHIYINRGHSDLIQVRIRPEIGCSWN